MPSDFHVWYGLLKVMLKPKQLMILTPGTGTGELNDIYGQGALFLSTSSDHLIQLFSHRFSLHLDIPMMSTTFFRTIKANITTPIAITMLTLDLHAGFTMNGPLNSTIMRKPIRQSTKKYS